MLQTCAKCGKMSRTDVKYCPVCGSYMSESIKNFDHFEFEPEAMINAAGETALPGEALQSGRLIYPSCWTRLASALLDYIILLIVVTPGLIILWLSPANRGGQEAMMALGGILIFIGAVVILGYNIIRLSTKGQTIAKMMLKIKIVSHSDGMAENPGFSRAVLLRAVIPALLFCLPYLGVLLFIADHLLIFRDDHRCIHDFLAGTIVVRA